MPVLRAIPRDTQPDEPWANGAGSTTVVLREPDCAEWTVRISVANVERDGPFSELPVTRRLLVPLDAAMTLRFPNGTERHAERFDVLHFDGSPAPCGLLPEGPTRDFNLMLRGESQGELFTPTLVDSMTLLPDTRTRWLVYLVAGHAMLHAGAGRGLTLRPHDAALVTADDAADQSVLAGDGHIVLVKLYA